ncbi:hypothetical protein NEDG_00007 [Nematocida displodere]|uniref:Uncharacterized protein n=1 Tax=Nematocida displodere TaxID=1805483 RepID=A0A177EK83_9MICR|nr:hypothetical protein NEDG_00007 [Nematocida displodere]
MVHSTQYLDRLFLIGCALYYLLFPGFGRASDEHPSTTRNNTSTQNPPTTNNRASRSLISAFLNDSLPIGSFSTPSQQFTKEIKLLGNALGPNPEDASAPADFEGQRIFLKCLSHISLAAECMTSPPTAYHPTQANLEQPFPKPGQNKDMPAQILVAKISQSHTFRSLFGFYYQNKAFSLESLDQSKEEIVRLMQKHVKPLGCLPIADLKLLFYLFSEEIKIQPTYIRLLFIERWIVSQLTSVFKETAVEIFTRNTEVFYLHQELINISNLTMEILKGEEALRSTMNDYFIRHIIYLTEGAREILGPKRATPNNVNAQVIEDIDTMTQESTLFRLFERFYIKAVYKYNQENADPLCVLGHIGQTLDRNLGVCLAKSLCPEEFTSQSHRAVLPSESFEEHLDRLIRTFPNIIHPHCILPRKKPAHESLPSKHYHDFTNLTKTCRMSLSRYIKIFKKCKYTIDILLEQPKGLEDNKLFELFKIYIRTCLSGLLIQVEGLFQLRLCFDQNKKMHTCIFKTSDTETLLHRYKTLLCDIYQYANLPKPQKRSFWPVVDIGDHSSTEAPTNPTQMLDQQLADAVPSTSTQQPTPQ